MKSYSCEEIKNEKMIKDDLWSRDTDLKWQLKFTDA